jgi:hypothetical protein
LNQKLAAGGYLDLLTKDELSEAMGHNLDAAIVKWYRGIDYLTFVGVGNGQPTFAIPYSPEAGYCWSLKLVAAQVGNSVSIMSIYINSIASPAIATASVIGPNDDAIATWSANQVVLKDGQQIFLWTGSLGTINTFRLHVKQVPVEMQGKL